MIEQAISRLKARLQELSAWQDLATEPLSGNFKTPDTDWQPIAVGEPWPRRQVSVQFFFEVELPPEWRNKWVWVRLNVGGEGLLSLNGKTIGGLNPYHREYPLGQHEGMIGLEVEAVPKGMFGVPNFAPKLETAQLFVPDLLVRALHADLACVLDAVPQVSPDVGQLLVDLLDQTFARIRLPRSPTEAYLSQLERSDWRNMTAQIWEEWKFEGAGIALSDAHRESLEVAREYLKAGLETIASRYPSVGKLLVSGHAHIDLAWLWPVAETRRKIRRTFATVLHLMERYPDLYFNQSSAQAYAWLEQDDPEVFKQIAARVQEGRWELVGGMWVEPDGNLLSGESWVRQILYGQRYFEQKFGQRAKVAWLPDTFGFAANLPQLFVQGGLPYFFTTKMNWNETNPFPHDLWQWEGLDGSRVLAHGFWNPNESYNGRLEALDLAKTWQNFKGKRYFDTSLLTAGYGDGGGGPSAEIMERHARYQAFPGLPKAKMGRVEELYGAVEERSSKSESQETTDRSSLPLDLPVWQGEMYLELHRATYTTQSEIKRLNRKLEQTLVEAEVAWSMVGMQPTNPKLTVDSAFYPASDLETLWKTLLLNQFHDILPGSGVHSVPKDAVEGLQAALEQAQDLREEGLGLLSHPVFPLHSEAVAHVLVWNLSGQDRPLQIKARRTSNIFFRLVGSDGHEVPYQESGEDILVSSKQTVPAFGYCALAVLASVEARKPFENPVTLTGNVLENQYLRLEVAPDGTLASLFDKTAGRETLDGPGNQLWAYTDIPRFWEAWDIDASHASEGQPLKASQIRMAENGPIRAGIWVEYKLGESRIEQIYWLWAGAKRLEIETTVHWQERRTLLRALFPLKIRSHEAWFETAFGAVARPTHSNTSWDAAQFEVPALRWVDLSEADYGLSLLNDGKYGHSAKGNVLGLSLLRGSVWPDPFADTGEHRFSYALFPHKGDWRGETIAQAEGLNTGLHALILPAAPGEGAAKKQGLSLGGGSLRLSALKRAEKGEGYILRLYESIGARGETELELSALGIKRIRPMNLLEEPGDPIPVQNGKVRISYAPYQVISLRLEG